MTFAEIVLFALALCVDSFFVSTAVSLQQKPPLRRRLLIALVFAIFQGLFPLLGALLGEAFKTVVESVDHWIAFGLLALIGAKMISDAFSSESEKENRFDISRFRIICLLAIATSIDAFVVGITWGLQYHTNQVVIASSVTLLFTFIVSFIGGWLGCRHIAIRGKAAGIVAGIVLILLGLKILIEHLFLQAA
ncbi:MAG: manganese efflux pump [Bacteroidales bacterium]|nr:manganese efflux pump [Bacteroidales bacterium]